MTLSGTPAAFKLFRAVGAVSKLDELDLILAIRTSVGSPAPDISEMLLFVKEPALAAAGVDGWPGTETTGCAAGTTLVLDTGVTDEAETSALQGT